MRFERIQPSSAHTEAGKLDIGIALVQMQGLLQQIHGMGRNDIEIDTAQRYMNAVQSGNMTPEEGVRKMRVLLESKQHDGDVAQPWSDD